MRLTAFILLAACAAAANGQQIRGVVRDSVSHQPVPGAVVSLLDSAGVAVGRVITNETGVYAFARATNARRLRAQRLGFRLREMAVPSLPAADIIQVDLDLIALPSLLERVRVVAQSRCPIGADDDQALALLQQARAGLLSLVVAREANRGTLVRLTYSRELEGPRDRIISQEVRVDSVKETGVSFRAQHTAEEYVRLGFRETVAAAEFYSGPDADILLDESFAGGYCFRIVRGDGTRPNQIGLGFDPVDRKSDRIDISGALWIDTVARALRGIDFRYLSLRTEAEAIHPGGRTDFREMPNGVVVIDRWVVRSPRLTSLVSGHPTYAANETGGELASGVWPDGTTWQARLGKLRLRVLMPDGRPAEGTMVKLANSNYYGLASAKGDVEIDNLLPGPYAVRASDHRLIAIGVADRPQLQFIAVRDSTMSSTITARTLVQYVVGRCALFDTNPGRAVLVIGNVLTARGGPARQVDVNFTRLDEKKALYTVKALDDGIFTLCLGESRRRTTLKITTRTLRGMEAGTIRTLSDSVTIVQLRLAPGLGGTFAMNSPDSRVTVRGVAFDSLRGIPLRGAFVGLAGSGQTTSTDSAGAFDFDNVPPGTYTVTVQDDAFDAVGLSGASSLAHVVDGRDTVRVYLPSFRHFWGRMCRTPASDSDVGIYFGTVLQNDGRIPVPGATVNASWIEGTPPTASNAGPKPRSQLNVVSDSTGAYALCGIPRAATSIQMRAVSGESGGDAVSVDPLTNVPILRRDLRLRPPF